jgi:Helix-turn-helix
MRIRLKKGLTQEQFVDVSGFSQQYISGLERSHSGSITSICFGPQRKRQNEAQTHNERKTAQRHRITASSSLISASAQIGRGNPVSASPRSAKRS